MSPPYTVFVYMLNWKFTAAAAVVALCLPPLSDEHLKLPAEPIPTKEAVGLQYDQVSSAASVDDDC